MLPKFISRRLGYIDPEEFNAYRSVLPQHVLVNIRPEGKYRVVKITSIDDRPLDDLLVSQARNNDEIIDVINDLVLMYRDVPESYRPYFKHELQPEGLIPKQDELVFARSQINDIK